MQLGNVDAFGSFGMQRGVYLATCPLSTYQQGPGVRFEYETMAEKSANKGSEPAKNGQEEGLHETLLSSADKVRQALGAWAAKL